jgi:lipid II:glycine glycyltransferase (peptidoglycan interpeptide bridge formation enzyme)
MDLIGVSSAPQWNAALASIPNAHVLQTWEWGEVKSGVGWRAERFLFVDKGAPRAAAQILRRPVPRTPFGIMYVPKGPALDYEDTVLFEAVLHRLEDHARRRHSIFVKIDPDIPCGAPAAGCLTRRDWHISEEQIQYRNTVVLDLTRSEQELLDAMKPKSRYNIRLAEKRGVRVEPGTEAEMPVFYRLYAETGARDGFLIRRFPYYREVWETMLRGNLARMLFARIGTETIAALMLFFFSRRAWYFYGASSGKYRDSMPNHLLQWEAIRWAKGHGCREYDFWGAPDHLAEDDPMFGVYRFKSGFGGKFVERIAAHDFVVNPLLKYIYSVARPRYLARLRGKHSTLVGTE